MIPTPSNVGQPARKLQQVAWMQATDSSPMTMPQLPPSLSNGGAIGSSGTPAPGFPLPAAPGVASPGGVAAPSTVSPKRPSTAIGLPCPAHRCVACRTAHDRGHADSADRRLVRYRGVTAFDNYPTCHRPSADNGRRAARQSKCERSSGPCSPCPRRSGHSVIPNQAPLSTTIPPRVVVSNDYAPIAQPRLDGFATVDNCRNVTGPSSYRAAGFFNCAPASYGVPSYTVPAAYTPPPAQIAPVSTLPPAAVYPATGPSASPERCRQSCQAVRDTDRCSRSARRISRFKSARD